MAGRGRQLSLLDLPDELLGLVLSHARGDCLEGDGNLLLACKRLLCVYMSERALWRKVAWSFPRLTIAGEQQGVDEAAAEEEQPQPRPFAEQDRYLTSKLVLLQRVAGMVEVLEIDASPLLLYQDDASGDSEWRAEEYLAVLQPGMLRGLGIQCTPAMPGSLVRAVGRFTGLTGLRMITEQPAPAATSAVLRRLPLLQRLQLQAAQMAAGTVPALLALQQLTWLQLEGPSAAGETFLSLQQLSSLCGLSLQNACPRGVELDIVRHYTAPAPAAFPAGLASYNFGEDYDFIQVGNAVLGSCVYGDMPSCGPGQLSLQDIRRLASLQELLAALLPAGALLTQLELIGDLRRGSPLPPLLAQPHGLEGCTQLATLESLSLHRMARDPADAELNRVLQTLLPQAPQLHKLSLGDCEVGQMPSCVATATRLRQLHLVGCGLTHLPDGQYLEGLQLLALRRNSFDELPRALTAATRLRELQWDGANLTEADVQAVLARLPHLTTYVLERPSPAVVDCITRAVPAIDVQFVRSDAKLEPLAPWGLRGPAYI